MSEPFTFTFATPNIGLPFLTAGQAQKEFFINQALSIVDALHRNTVLASQSAPPALATDGDCYRVTEPASGAWTNRANQIAVKIGDDWHFIAPSEGMRFFDIAADQALFFRATWQYAIAPSVPASGTVVDTEARAALVQLIEALRSIAILAPLST